MSEGFPWLDLLFLIIILYSLVMGFLKGFFREVISLTFFILGLITAFGNWRQLSSLLRPFLKIGLICDFLSFMIILIAFMLLGAIVAFLIRKIFVRGPIKFIDRIAGLLFGGIKGIFIVLIIIILIIAFIPNSRIVERSTIAFYSLDITDSLVKIFPSYIYEKYMENIKKIGGDNGKRI
jgi:membrane protein required for colicin V production